MALALASSWRRLALTGAAVLALGACETGLTTEEPAPAPAIERSPRIASELARGQQALAAGNLQTAQAAFTAALRGSPDDPEPAIGLAETYLALGDIDTAGRLFDLVSAKATRSMEGRLLQGRGLVALHQGRTDEALDLLQQSVDRNAAQWRAWAGLGRAYGRLGKSRQARKAFDRAEETAPAPAAVINDIGMSYLEENDPAAALEQFQRALAMDPANAHASGNARIARAMLRDYDAAVSGARPEELPDVLNNVGYIAVVNGDFDVADRLLRRAVEVSPVFHEAASANLDLLAQAKKGVPVLEVAGAAIAGSEAPEDIAATGVTGGPTASDGKPTPAPSAISTNAWQAPEGGPADAHPESAEAAGAEPLPPLLAAAMPASTPESVAEARPDGFRWEPPSPDVKRAIARARAARKAAERQAALERARRGDPRDPRTEAWPTIAPTQPATGAEPDQLGVSAEPGPAGDPRVSTSPRVAPADGSTSGTSPAPPAGSGAVAAPGAGTSQVPAGAASRGSSPPAPILPVETGSADASSAPAEPAAPAPEG